MIDRLDKFLEALGRYASMLLFAMILLSVSVVVLRYVFGLSAIISQELVTYIHAFILSITIAYGLKKDSHVRVDIIYQYLQKSNKALINIIGCLVFLIPFCIFFIWVSFPYVKLAWVLSEKSVESGGIPAVFLLKSLLLVLPSLLLVQGLLSLVSNTKQLLNNKDMGAAVDELESLS